MLPASLRQSNCASPAKISPLRSLRMRWRRARRNSRIMSVYVYDVGKPFRKYFSWIMLCEYHRIEHKER